MCWHASNFHSDGKTGVDGHVRLGLLAKGGQMESYGGQLVVDGSDAVTLYLAIETTFRCENPVGVCRQRLAAAMALPYAELKQRHIADHQTLFRRASLDLGRSPHATLPVDQRIAAVQNGEDDPALAVLLFQFGRYLLIGCSRPIRRCRPTYSASGTTTWPVASAGHAIITWTSTRR